MKKKEFCVLGIMSGTSIDGLDFSLIKSDGMKNVKIIKNKCNIWESRIHLKLLEKIFYSFIAIFKLVFSKKDINEKIDNKCNILLKKLKIL